MPGVAVEPWKDGILLGFKRSEIATIKPIMKKERPIISDVDESVVWIWTPPSDPRAFFRLSCMMGSVLLGISSYLILSGRPQKTGKCAVGPICPPAMPTDKILASTCSPKRGVRLPHPASRILIRRCTSQRAWIRCPLAPGSFWFAPCLPLTPAFAFPTVIGVCSALAVVAKTR